MKNGKKSRWIIIVIGVIALPAMAYLVGPRVMKPSLAKELPTAEPDPLSVESALAAEEAAQPGIKPDNEARIVWYDSITRRQTPYALLYLHGFTASWREGAPTNLQFARRYGMNLLLTRLAGHGVEAEEPLLDMTPDALYDGAKIALARALRLGERVLVMGTSTGGTLALMLAADFPTEVAGVILLSPNIRVADTRAVWTTRPWGVQMGRLISGGRYRIIDLEPYEAPYWTGRYRLEAVGALQKLLEVAMQPETFRRVQAPTFVGYYYQDEEHQDGTVSVAAIRWMADQLGTSQNLLSVVAFPNANHHVIGCDLTSDDWGGVRDATYRFAEETLGLQALY